MVTPPVLHVRMTRALPLLALATLTGCNGCASEADAGPPIAIVLVLDGVRTDEFAGAATSDLTGVTGEAYAEETMRDVVPDATRVLGALNPGVTITAPAHAALLTGREEPYANFPLDPAIGPGLYRPEHPTIFEELRAQLGLSEDEVVLLANTELLMGVTESLAPGYGGGGRYDLVVDTEKDAPINDDAPVVDALVALLDAGPRLVVVNLHDADRAGHYGEADAYVDDVAKLDGLVADFWRTVKTDHPGLADRLLLVVTTDHGRHRHDDNDGWHSHGDACTGCRELPLLLLGAAEAGVERTDIVTTLDLAPTLAAHLGVTLPWAEGLPYLDALPAFDGQDIAFRTGDVHVSAAGGRTAHQAWRDDREARSDVRVDGAVVSTPGIFAAEDPTLFTSDIGTHVCFREIDLAADADELPWRPRCLAEADGGWAEMGLPDETVSPYWRLALTERDGQLWAAWPNNPNGGTDAGDETGVGLAVAAWDPAAGWGEALRFRAIFPTDTAIVATARGIVAAVGTSLGDPSYRYTRRVRIFPVNLAGDPAPDEEVDLTFRQILGEGGRLERPALRAEGDTVWLAALGHRPEGDGAVALVGWVSSEDGGLTWGAPEAAPDAGPPFAHLGPAWDGAHLVWAVAPDTREGEARLCRALPGDAEAACVGVGSPRIDSFTVEAGVATVSRDAGVGAWERAMVEW